MSIPSAPRIRIATQFPLGLFRAWSWWQPDSRALVHPFPEADAPALPLSAGAQAPRSDVALVISRGFGSTNAACLLRAAAA